MSSTVAWEIGKEDPLGLRRMVTNMKNGACNLLVLQKIFEVDWTGKFNGKLVL